MLNIRSYKASDWPMIADWWKTSEEIPPTETMMPLESSFVLEIEGVPALAVAVYLTNTPDVAYAENFIGNPELSGKKRRYFAKALSDFILNFVRGRGYKRLVCFSEKPVLVERYQELGFYPTLSGVTALVRLT